MHLAKITPLLLASLMLQMAFADDTVQPAGVWHGSGAAEYVPAQTPAQSESQTAPGASARYQVAPPQPGSAQSVPAPAEITDDAAAATAKEREGIMPEMGPWLPIPDVMDLPCPRGWTVRPNPSIHNSLSYIDDSGNLAVSVTSIKQNPAHQVDAENYARVAAAQLHCDLPAKSNLIVEGWGFTCPDEKIEALVYGDPANLVLVAFAGVNSDTETLVEDFVRFLIDQGARR